MNKKSSHRTGSDVRGDWARGVDAASDRYYYDNLETSESTWEAPPEWLADSLLIPPPPPEEEEEAFAPPPPPIDVADDDFPPPPPPVEWY